MNSAKKHFPATLNHLPTIMSWVRSHIGATPLSEKEKKEVELALEEAVVNIINHSKTRGEFTLACNHTPQQQIEFVLTDQGQPFNPLKVAAQVDPLVPLEQRNPGGLGLIFMKKYMDSLLYRREDETNILTLIKQL